MPRRAKGTCKGARKGAGEDQMTGAKTIKPAYVIPHNTGINRRISVTMGLSA